MIAKLIREAADAGVFLSCVSGRLRFKLAVETFPEPLKNEILAHKPELLDFLTKSDGRGERDPGHPRIALREGSLESLPASFSQERLWFLDRRGGSVQYNMQGVFRVTGAFAPEVAQRALRQIVARHEPLRTVFIEAEEGLRQQVRVAFDFTLKLFDFTELSGVEQDSAVRKVISDDALLPFDLGSDLMLRAAFIHLSAMKGLLLLNAHHIACDGWSVDILIRELAQLYEAFSQGKPDPLSPLPIHYADFTLWQRDTRRTQLFEQQLRYWRDTLAGAPTTLELPTDRPRPGVASNRGGKLCFTLPNEVLQRLMELAHSEQATLFMVLLTAYQALLAWLSGQTDVLVGAPIACRTHAQTESLVGYFANTLVLRTHVDGRLSFRDLLRRVKEVALGAYANQDLPFERLVAELRPERDPSRQPLFQVLLAVQSVPPAELILPGLSTERHMDGDGPVTSKFDFSMLAIETSGGMQGVVEYARDLFDPETIGRWLSSFQELLSAAGSDPECPLFRLSPLSQMRQGELAPGSHVDVSHLGQSAGGARGVGEPLYLVPAPAADAIAPARGIQMKLAQIWAEILQCPPDVIGAQSNFFALGGHSLASVRLVARIRARLGVELSVNDIFDNAQLSTMAELIAQSGNAPPRPAVTPHARNQSIDDLPTSFAQERLWFIDRLGGGSAQYNMPCALRFQGVLDADIAEKALAHIVQRHESLRTVYREQDDQPRQIIRSSVEFTLRRVDLRELHDEAQERAVRAIVAEDALRPFDLSRDPMLRAAFVRNSQSAGVLLLNVHHIAADGWSVGVLVTEFAQLYEAISQGRPSPLAPLSVQYSDYVLWQRDWLQGRLLEQQLAYWERQLAGLPQVHTLPLDRPRPAIQTFDGALHLVEIDQRTTTALRKLALSERATLFMALHAAFTLLLARTANSLDIVVGTPVANRAQRELEPLVGLFVNTLVLRADCSGSRSFREYLSYIRALNLDAQANQDVPFERVVRHLKPARSASHSPLFQIMLGMDADEPPLPSLPGVRFEVLQSDETRVKVDLNIQIGESQSGLTVGFSYNKDLFEPGSIASMGERLRTLLGAIVAGPDLDIHHLPVLPESERCFLSNVLDETRVSFADDRCLHELFETQVDASPDRVGLVFGRHQLSYAQLNRRANQLARHLLERGVRPAHPVGLSLERSPDMVIALLAILKAGAAYVPLDGNYPAERLRYMAEDCGMEFLVARSNTQFPAIDASRIVEVGSAQWRARLSDYSTENLQRSEPQSPSSLAYVIYTSGSTGNPKGVMIEHRPAANLIHGLTSRLPELRGRRWLLLTSISFDIALYEWMGCLSNGGTCVIASEQEQQDIYLLKKLITRQGIGFIQATPSRWWQLLEAGWRATNEPVALCGGETLTAQLQERLSEAGVLLWNCYGPTEATVWSLINPVNGRDPLARRLSLGKGLPNYCHYVLGYAKQLAPTGTVGELYIGGAGLARGYIGRPELTAERFVQNPFSSDVAARLYRTGDLVRCLADGQIEFVGRSDNQIKLRGFRIELGEVEHHLTSLDCVKEAVVMLREGADAEKRLVAYLTRSESVTEDEDPRAARFIAEIRAALQAKLPSHMIPDAFMVIDSLPLTPNGKLDRKALPSDDPVGRARPQFVAPRLELERLLCQTWRELLNLEQVGIHDNFFDLGGNSLLSIRLRNAVSRCVGHEVSLTDIFEYPTVAEMTRRIASRLTRQQAASQEHKLVAEGGSVEFGTL